MAKHSRDDKVENGFEPEEGFEPEPETEAEVELEAELDEVEAEAEADEGVEVEAEEGFEPEPEPEGETELEPEPEEGFEPEPEVDAETELEPEPDEVEAEPEAEEEPEPEPDSETELESEPDEVEAEPDEFAADDATDTDLELISIDEPDSVPEPFIDEETFQSAILVAGSTETLRQASTSEPRKRRRVDLLLWMGIALIAVAVGIAGFLLWRHFSAQSTYNTLANLSGLDTSLVTDPNYSPELEDTSIDWDALQAMNPDIIGWLTVPGTRLNYPIVQAADNSYYLNHTADGSVNASGAIFLDYMNSSDLSDECNYIYGHNMLGNTMFSEMTGYTSDSFIAEHPRIIIYMPDRTYDLTVIGAMKCRGTDPIRRVTFTSSYDFTSFRGLLGSYLVSGQYDKLVSVDNVYCFSTCELFDTNSRIIVLATDTNRDTGQETP